MRGLCCFWVFASHPYPEKPARDEAINPTDNLSAQTTGSPSWTSSTKQHLLPVILTHNGNRSIRLPQFHCLHDFRSNLALVTRSPIWDQENKSLFLSLPREGDKCFSSKFFLAAKFLQGLSTASTQVQKSPRQRCCGGLSPAVSH
jgi:hypothetical protein